MKEKNQTQDAKTRVYKTIALLIKKSMKVTVDTIMAHGDISSRDTSSKYLREWNNEANEKVSGMSLSNSCMQAIKQAVYEERFIDAHNLQAEITCKELENDTLRQEIDELTAKSEKQLQREQFLTEQIDNLKQAIDEEREQRLRAQLNAAALAQENARLQSVHSALPQSPSLILPGKFRK
ncbi:DNA-binding protein [Sedimenticola hydrogenitrophicus]|uniref:DNA-binding protein n=1 Tax=Sedimenticola hydrogenitrophicus TaxID=2967975 RepID=UPI0023AF9AE0|nr:DNA-binding protein [Sedimenticola hydrogenitrophicus]